MGTNFYWRAEGSVLPTGEEDPTDWDNPAFHIGKRSAAGPFCWDCDETLIVGGRSHIHQGGSGVHTRCPKCGREPVADDGLPEAAAIELGFAQPRAKRPKGVSSTCSFSWAQDPERAGSICERRAAEQIIEDEYGTLLTGREFLDMLLANCGVQFTDSIGVAFS